MFMSSFTLVYLYLPWSYLYIYIHYIILFILFISIYLEIFYKLWQFKMTFEEKLFRNNSPVSCQMQGQKHYNWQIQHSIRGEAVMESHCAVAFIFEKGRQ